MSAVVLPAALFADVVSELSEYWQTPGLSGMDTIYGPARVTASDLVKKWRISMQGGDQKQRNQDVCSH